MLVFGYVLLKEIFKGCCDDFPDLPVLHMFCRDPGQGGQVSVCMRLVIYVLQDLVHGKSLFGYDGFPETVAQVAFVKGIHKPFPDIGPHLPRLPRENPIAGTLSEIFPF